MHDKAILEAARALRPRLLAERDRVEAARRLPEDLARNLADAGFFRLSLPAAYGGLDLSPMRTLDVLEELARADASVAWCVWNGNTHWTTARLAPAVAREIHADPAVIVANSTRASGEASAVPGGYRVSGRWSMVSVCQLSAWMFLLCTIHEGGAPRLTASGAPDIRFVVVPSSACEIIDTWTTGGLRGTGSHDVVLRDMFVPDSHATGFADPLVLPEPRYRIPPFCRVIPGLGAMTLGIARSAIDTLVEIAAAKQPERTKQTLRDNHLAQSRLSRAEALVRSARLFLFESLEQLWRKLLADESVTQQKRAQVRLATCHAVGCAMEAVDLMYATAGGDSLYTSCSLERAFRDVHAMAQHIGVNPRIMESTGRVLFGLEPDTPLL